VNLRLKDFDHAVADFSQAIELNSGYLNAYQNRAVARRHSGDRAGAAADDRKAAELASSTRSGAASVTARR
jgi:tetratricopeptide (TPR) repeat protein